MRRMKSDGEGDLVIFIFRGRDLARLREGKDVLIWFIRPLSRLLFFIFGGDLSLFFNYLSFIELSRFNLFCAFGSSLYLASAFDSSL